MSFLAVLDPPWASDRGGGKVKRGADRHYGLVGADALASTYRAAPCWTDTGPALVFVWATTLALCRGDFFALVGDLGLRTCASFVWAKVDDRATPNLDEWVRPARRAGLGQWSRCEHEFLFVCRRGSVRVPSTTARRRSMIYAPRARHSEKPEVAWSVIESIARDVMPGVVGVEFNARSRRRGWNAFGRLEGEDAPPRFERDADEARMS